MAPGTLQASRKTVLSHAPTKRSAWYSAYGLSVLSQVPLPLPETPARAAETPDITIRFSRAGSPPPPDGPAIAWAPCAEHGWDTVVSRGPGGAWISHRGIGTCHVAPDARLVDVYPEPGCDPQALGLAMVGPVVLFMLHKLGRPSLHASGVVTPRGAAVFLGPQGQGKSTMAATFLREGMPLLTDDALPLQANSDGIYGTPGLPFMKLWHETVRGTLALVDDLPNLMANFEKKFLALRGRLEIADQPSPIRAIYLLKRYDPHASGDTEIRLDRLSPHQGVAALLAHTSNRSYFLPAEEPVILPLYARLVHQAPVRVLRYPNGFEFQAAIRACVLTDLAEG